MNLGELELICRYPGWEFFGTQTFARTPKQVARARGGAIQFFYRLAKVVEVPFPSLVWVLREERGEAAGRLHYHYLIGGTSLPVAISGCYVLKRIWERAGMGFADVKVFEAGLRGPEYMTKWLSGAATAAGAAYEVAKFRSPDRLIFSRSLGAWLARQDREKVRGRVWMPAHSDAALTSSTTTWHRTEKRERRSESAQVSA